MKFVLLITLVVIVIAVVHYLRKQSWKVDAPPAAPTDPFKREAPVEGDPRQIRIGDILEYLGQSFAVRGSVQYTEGPYRWTEHYLDDAAGARRWISVEDDPDLEVVMWTALTDHDLNPDNKTVMHGGMQYARYERGSAIYTATGTTGLQASGRVEYVDYRAPNDRRISCESFGGVGWEAAIGEVIPSGVLTIYPVARFSTD